MISVWRIEGRHTQKRQILKPTRCDTGPKQCWPLKFQDANCSTSPTHIISISWPKLNICIDKQKQDTTGWSMERCTNDQIIRTWVAQCMFDTIQFYYYFLHRIFTNFTWIFIFFLYLIFMEMGMSCKMINWACRDWQSDFI